MIVEQRLAQANFDRTIQCQVASEPEEFLQGYKYRVKYQDSQFYVYSKINTYVKDEMVYVLIPENDMRKKKIIIGPA